MSALNIYSKVPDVSTDIDTWFYDKYGTYDKYGRFQVPTFIRGQSSRMYIRYNGYGYYNNISRVHPAINRYRDPYTPQDAYLYAEYNIPPYFGYPDSYHGKNTCSHQHMIYTCCSDVVFTCKGLLTALATTEFLSLEPSATCFCCNLHCYHVHCHNVHCYYVYCYYVH